MTSAIVAHVAAAMAALGVVLSTGGLGTPALVAVLVATCIGVAIVAAAATNRIVYHLFGPLRELRRAMGLVSQEDYGVRLPEHGFRDLVVLAKRFNIMAERLEQARIAETAHAKELAHDAALQASNLEKVSEQLHTLDYAKDAFLSNISHEMRTPLTSILAAVEILQHFCDGDQNAREEFLEIIDRESRRLLKLIESILEFAIVEAEEIELHTANHDFHDMIMDAAEDCSAAAAERGISIVTDLVHPGIRICCDRGRIERVVSNLIENAIKFSPEGSRVELELDIEAGHAVLRVLDEGPGVPPERRTVIFGRFGQAPSLLTDKPEGVGLGLPLSAGIAKAHGGNLHYEDRDYRGACFVLRIPLAKSPEPIVAGQPGR
ncbi:MAG: HAMP domain-containing histidine kinase [Planctomycetes bacterium]|nr:HAMP domain-containing histidine kinase [Planctomycetota bacterium]